MAPGAPIKSAHYSSWENNTHKNWWRDPSLRACSLYCVLLCLGTFTLGYDGSYLNALQAIPRWNAYFDHPSGSFLGLISAAPYFPNVLLLPFVSMASDRLGRKKVIWMSSIGIIIGAAISTAASGRSKVGLFIAGRAIVGGFTCFNVNGTICLLSELCHPRLRGVATSLYLTAFFIGSILASWVGFGCVYWDSDWAWRLCTLLQILGPCVLIVAALFFIPESPRWLAANSRGKEAREILIRLHANGKVDDQLVLNEMEEIDTALQMDADNSNVTWSSFLATKGNRKRLFVLTLLGTGSQMQGNNIISYYLAPVLRTVGITDSPQQAGINGGMSIFNFIMAVIGASLVDKVGRRPLWLTSTAGGLLSFVFITALSATFAKDGSSAVGGAVVAFLFIFYAFYAVGWTPLAYSYAVEIMPYGLRAKGMAYFTMMQNIMQIFCQLVNPIALDAIGWKYYAIYIPIISFYLVNIYFFFIETKGYTAEEVALLFDQEKNARDIVEQLGSGDKSRNGQVEMIEDVLGTKDVV